ncbi:transposase [Rhizobium ruizarguesonis]|uniref:transposase n=1 Tax=Rhizobium ruizarguesonis TaxID=2081791 RepID=UPI0010309772|nr:IS1595 family transposase [Rhizobium ruizarguesonis]TBE12204.1 IS1595 family transposase [Rhizobium ruizarguesonis]
MSESLFPTRWANDRPPSLERFTADFPDDYACAEYLAKKRWRNGFKCPRCGGNRAWRLEARPWGYGCLGDYKNSWVWYDRWFETILEDCKANPEHYK